jgi:polysaccharide biosynthesis/export protein
MKKQITLLCTLSIILLASSCGLYKDKEYKDISYYQDIDRSGSSQQKITNYSPLRIQPGDILGINVNDINQQAASVFNTSVNRVNGNNLDSSPTNPVYGYKVDGNGDIQLPLIGMMGVGGFTTDEVAKKLTTDLLPYLKSPIVSVRILNFKVSVLGDVAKPDVYTISNEHVNVNEALSMAGDLTITAKRTNVLLIREQNGKRQFYTFDLTKKDVFDSPYYYLHNNDILYVDPDKTKYDAVSRHYKSSSLTISALSVVAIVLSAALSAFLVYHH